METIKQTDFWEFIKRLNQSTFYILGNTSQAVEFGVQICEICHDLGLELPPLEFLQNEQIKENNDK